MDHVAYCYRSGEIEIVPAHLAIPEGVLPFACGPRDRLEEIISTRARHSHHAEHYLVPGLPEAEDDVDVVMVMAGWLDWAFGEFPIAAHDPIMRRVS